MYVYVCVYNKIIQCSFLWPTRFTDLLKSQPSETLGEIDAPTWRCGMRKQRCPKVRSCGRFLSGPQGLRPKRLIMWV